MKKALITGITGQDGSYLSELLLEEGYEVHGMVRRHSNVDDQFKRIEHIRDKIELHYGDVSDGHSVYNVLDNVKPDEIYNLAAQSHVRISFDMPQYTFDVNSTGTLHILETCRKILPNAKIYQATSSEIFGNRKDLDGYQREMTSKDPVSPYGCSKLLAHNLIGHYRRAYGMFSCSGILFNHESPRRGLNFVTNKVVKGAVEIKKGIKDKLVLGNLDARRDWGHAKDYVKAMYMMMQYWKADDWIVSTGVTHSVRDLCDYVFKKLDMDYNDYVITDQKYLRPEELDELKGHSLMARRVLKWEPEYTFESMLDEMIEYWQDRL